MNMIMVKDGHIALAAAILNETQHLAWGTLPGDYPDKWGVEGNAPTYVLHRATETLTHVEAGGTDRLSNPPASIEAVVYGETTYQAGADYLSAEDGVDWSPAGAEPDAGAEYSVTYVFRVDVADITVLEGEVGRRPATVKNFAYEDPNGTIVANDTTWSLTDTPTRHLYFQFKFDADDASAAVIYQLGIFLGTITGADVPAGQYYLAPGDTDDPGRLMMAENVQPFARHPATREMFEYVITF